MFKIYFFLSDVLSDLEPYQDSGSEYVPSDEDDPRMAVETNSAIDDGGKDDTGKQQFKPKKRIRNMENWKRNLNKKKRCAGEQYTTQLGKVVPAKVFKHFECMCPNKCHLRIPAARQAELHKNYYSLESRDLQTSYLFGLIKVVNKLRTYTQNQVSKRNNTRMYYLPDSNGIEQKVCKIFFQSVFQVSSGRLDRLLKHKSTGSPAPCDKRGRHPPSNKTSIERKNEVKQFIERFPSYESHYCRPKSSNRKYLSPDLSLGKMYELYKNDSNNPVSFYIFRNVFNTEFNLTFHSPVTDSCKKCDLYNMQIKSTADELLKHRLEIERELHQRKAESAREGLKKDTELAKQGEVAVICFDLMKTLPTPVLTTGICYYKRQLWTYCFGVHDMATNDSYMFVWDESVASRGPQEIGSCLMYYIKNFVTSKRIIMYSDQCGGQNRNIKLSILCNHMVASPDFVVEQIDHKFLVSGHSYLPCDQDFGIIEKEKKFHPNIFVPSDWYVVIRNARKRNPFKVIEMKSNNFISTVVLENNITNRKIAQSKMKVEWLKIQWLQFQKQAPYSINFKYSNQNDVPFETVDISKRKSSGGVTELQMLYPNGNVINDLKKKDLLLLIKFIPPVFHEFYQSLRSSAQGRGGDLGVDSDNEEN